MPLILQGATSGSTTIQATDAVTQTITLPNATGTVLTTNGSGIASVNGIQFPATQSPSANANTLDDYEEGTWTPRTATNVLVESATYTKIGNRVTISGTIIHTGAITAYEQIALPFAPLAPTSETRYTGGVQFFEAGTGTSAINIRLLTQQNISPNSFFWGQSGTQAWPFSMTFDGTNGVSQYTFTKTYQV
jgi:hypothetical protein